MVTYSGRGNRKTTLSFHGNSVDPDRAVEFVLEDPLGVENGSTLTTGVITVFTPCFFASRDAIPGSVVTGMWGYIKIENQVLD